MATLVERRRFMQALAAASAAPAIAAAQAPTPAQAPAPGANTAGTSEAVVEVTTTLHDSVGVTVPRYFDDGQIAALRRLSGLLAPALDGKPGALDAGVPEFLDFHVGKSPAERSRIYRAGLDTLNHQSLMRFGKPFAEASDSEADQLIAGPLQVNWTPSMPADPLAAFLREAKADVMTATANSREYAEASGEPRRRGQRAGNVGLYWYTIE